VNAISQTASGLLALMVRQIRFEALGINSYELVHPEGEALPPWSAGSHLDIHLANGVIRQYSLCGDPADRFRYVIAVLREEAGRGGSRLLHDTLQVSHIVNVSLPRNNFAIAPDAARHLLIGGGIGITPLKAMAHELAAAGRPFTLVYCAKGPGHAAFREELEAAGARFHFDGGDPARALDIAALLREAEAGTHVYYCGPGGFMKACAAAAAHWPAGSVHSEHFKAPAAVPLETPDDPDGAFMVTIASTGAMIDVPAHQNIVEALAAAGVEIETSCVSGLCGTCKIGYLQGDVDHRDYILSEDERAAFMTACVSRARRGTLLLDL
jgi:vanillate O-demethylase ferredoxin subunit